MEKKLISTNQKTTLKGILTDKFYADHFKIYDLENLDGIERMTEGQYRYFLALFSGKSWFKLKQLLDNFINHK